MNMANTKIERKGISKRKKIVAAIIAVGLAVLIYPVAYTSALNSAIFDHDINRVKAILLFPGELNRSNGIPEFPGSTPLTQACFVSDVEIARLLIENGADVNYHGGDWPPFVVACSIRNDRQYDMVKALIDSGADINAEYMHQLPIVSFFALRYNFKHEATAQPTSEEAAAVFFLLVDSGADIRYDEAGLNWNMLFLAAWDANLIIVKYLVEEEMFDVNHRGLYGQTPLMGAAMSHESRGDVAEYLLSKGADKYAVDKYGKTAIDYARENGHEDIVRMLEGA